MTTTLRALHPPKTYMLTDVGNAERLADTAGHDFRWVPRWKSFIVWDGTRWARDEFGHMERMVTAMVRTMYRAAIDLPPTHAYRAALLKHAEKSESARGVEHCLKLVKSRPGVAISYTALNTQSMKLTVRNGTVDLATGFLGPHDRDDLCTKLVDIAFVEEAACPVWEQTLSVIMAGRLDLVRYIQDAIGYSLTGDTREQCLHLLHGAGSNGKSTILDVLEQLTGDYGAQSDFTTFLERRNDSGPRNDIARLAGARLVRSSEIGENKRLNEGLIKSITGGDTITARFLFSEDFEFRPVFKLWLAANHKPVIRGTDWAIWRRVRLLPFEVTITPEQRDDELPNKLKAELSGILNWAIAGCLRWLQCGLTPPDIVLAATAEYRSESDSIGTFISEQCELDGAADVSAGDLYKSFKQWADDNGEYVMSNQMFGRRLAERGFGVVKRNGCKFRKGLRLDDQNSYQNNDQMGWLR